MSEKRQGNKGFSLLELMVVIVILGILAAYVAPKFLSVTDDARINEARTQIKAFETALKMFKLDNGFYLTTEQGLEGLVQAPQAGKLPPKYRKGGYMDKIPKDPWGNDYVFLSPGVLDPNGFDIYSYGADGQPGGEEENKDITNWDVE